MAVTINIPSQVKTYANLAAFPASGSLKTIYIAEDTNKTYRWDGSTYVEISASAATGLTVGTTPISSGTIGRVLFEGTGNVLQQSSSLFWDSTNNRLGIGTSTPTFRLEVQGGDVRFANGLTIGTAGSAGWQFSSNTLQIIQNGFIGVDVAGGRHFNITNTAFSTYYFRVAPTTGNILIGTSTDAGFRLDVNGTARVSGQFDVVSGSANFRVNNNSTYVQLGIGSTAWSTYNSVETYYGGSQFYFQGGANFRFAGVGQFGFTGNPSNSAILQADSTTKGFLPPRMTTTQRNAIASPAAGLVVYDNTDNKHYGYNGTTWNAFY
jgi:hypothetical protein